ncbi:MAG: TetR/AcrR family transcriptional regulator [Burkholderiales bacterium]|nr:TetR/AcrR family transcriptional regulator [Burkholderiales bacterium]
MTALPKRRKSVRRAEILAAAREVFLARPYEQASITEIAERAGCVVGTIYGYFENKRELFDAVVTEFYDGLIADIEPRFAVIEGTADRLRFLVARHLQITVDDPSWLKVLDREARGAESYFGGKLHQLNRRYAQFVMRTLSDGIARGELRADLDPQMARDFLFGGLEHWVRNTVGRGRRNDPTAVAREMVRMLLDGWAAAPAERAAPWQGLEARIAKLEGRLKPAARARETEASK